MRLASLRSAVRVRHPGLLAALVLAALAAWPLLAAPGLVNTRAGGDSPFLLQRLHELEANLRAGTFPARWMPNAAYGLGYPFFAYYASLPFYLGTALSLAGAGLLWALRWTQLIGFLGAAAAMYGLANDIFDDQPAAFLAATAYTFAPFHMVNVYVRGDSLSEFYAFVFYPLILWGLARLRRAPTAGNTAWLALAYGCLMVTHNISAFIFSPLAGVALLWTVAAAPRARPRVFLLGVAGFILGAAISAWFWVPALLERGAVSLTDMTTGYFHYAGHFRAGNLVQWSFLFDYAIDAGQTPFVLGGLQAGLAVLALAILAASWPWQRQHLWLDLGLGLTTAYAVWPITPSSAPLWARVPLLPMVQFPWRFLSIAALASALVSGAALARLRRPSTRAVGSEPGSDDRPPGAPLSSPAHARRHWLQPRLWLAGTLGLLLAASALGRLQPQVLPLREADVTPERLQLYEHLTGNIGSTVRAEYLPQQAIPRPFTGAALLSGRPHPPPMAKQGELTAAELVEAGPAHQVWDVVITSSEALLVFQTYAFPGWQATVNSRPAPIDPTLANGRIALAVPGGQQVVTLRLGPTPLRSICELVSLATGLALGGLGLLALRQGWQQWQRLALGAAIAALVVVLAALSGALARQVQPPTALSTETMDFIHMPYLHSNLQGVDLGPSIRLVGYELAAREGRAGEPVLLRLHWHTPADGQWRAVVRLTTAAEPLFGAPGLATSEAPLAAVTEHTFTLPPEVAPGLALLAVEVHGPQGNVPARTALGAARGTIYLAPLRVLPPPAAPDLPAITSLSRHLDVLEAEVRQSAAGTLAVRVTWRPNAPLPEDYVATVRLLDPDGRQVPGATLDIQPRYNLYPTSLWPVGVPVADYYELRVPRGTPPSAGYQVEVGLYQARSLASIGSIRLPNVTLEHPTLAPGVSTVQTFEGGLALATWRLEREEVLDGEWVTAQVQWTALTAPLPEASYHMVLRDGQGRQVSAAQGPLSAHYPSNRWPRHALVNGRISVPVPAGTPAGSYRLELQVAGPKGRILGRWAPPGEVRVRTTQRSTALPSFTHALGVDFGGLIRLPGYDLERLPQQIAITFHWQALRAPGRDYTVFVHCFDPASESIVAQTDAMPLGDTYPTSRWVAGEVVSDRLVLDMSDVPPGRYHLAFGWYDPSTGQRLEPAGDSARITDGRVFVVALDW